MKKNYVSIQEGVIKKQLFFVGYTKDGGFFFHDLIRILGKEKKSFVLKGLTDVNNHGKRTVKAHYRAITSGEVKLTHHMDGRAQISGEGVISGFDEQGNPRGASVQSMPLITSNDGGPMFTFLTWGIEHFRDAKIDDTILELDPSMIHSADQGLDLNAYAVKGFYILKSVLPANFDYSSYVECDSPIEGRIKLKLVPSPDSIPGVLGFYAIKANGSHSERFGFNLSGAPGKTINGYCEGLIVCYPAPENAEADINLDYRKAS